MDTEKLVIYKENKDISAIKDLDLLTYKNLGIDLLMIDINTNIDIYLVDDIFSLNKKLGVNGINLMLNLSFYRIGLALLNEQNMDYSKILKASLTFINFLSKRGIVGFAIKDLDILYKNDKKNFLTTSILINKNIKYQNSRQITTAYTEDISLPMARHLARGDRSSFDFLIRKNSSKEKPDDYLESLSLNRKDFPSFNYKNFDKYIKTSLIAQTFLKKGVIILEDIKQDRFVNKFLNQVTNLKRNSDAIAYGSFLEIFKKYDNIKAFIREYKSSKVLVITNFSQSEFFLDLSMYIADFASYDYLFGNYGVRKVYKSILLRSFESIILTKNIGK